MTDYMIEPIKMPGFQDHFEKMNKYLMGKIKESFGSKPVMPVKYFSKTKSETIAMQQAFISGMEREIEHDSRYSKVFLIS